MLSVEGDECIWLYKEISCEKSNLAGGIKGCSISALWELSST